VQVETKRATPREARENPDACQSVTKVFVGGIPEEVEDDEIQTYFEQVGHIFLELSFLNDKAEKTWLRVKMIWLVPKLQTHQLSSLVNC